MYIPEEIINLVVFITFGLIVMSLSNDLEAEKERKYKQRMEEINSKYNKNKEQI